MPKMMSLTRHDYDGKTFFPGDELEVEHQFVQLLTLLERAKVIAPFEASQAVVTGTSLEAQKDMNPVDSMGYETREMVAARKPGKRAYNRKAA